MTDHDSDPAAQPPESSTERPDLPPEAEPRPDSLMGVGRVGSMLGVSRDRVRRFVADGLLKGVQVGRQMQVYWQDVKGLLTGGRKKADAPTADAPRSPMRLALAEVLAAFADTAAAAKLLDEPLGPNADVPAVPAALANNSQPTDDELATLDRESEPVLADRTVAAVLRGAIEAGASEVHVEPIRHGVYIRLRRDGELDPVFDADATTGAPLLRAFDRLLGLDGTPPAEPRRSRIEAQVGPRRLHLQAASMPTLHGPTLTIRITDPARVAPGLDELELWPPQLRVIGDRLRVPGNGLVLVTGDDAVARRMLRYALLRELTGPRRKLVSLEFPIEADLDGVTQIAAPPMVADMAAALRDAEVHAPDVISCSHVPTLDVVWPLLRSAAAGRLVIAELPGPATSAWAEWIRLGASPATLARVARLAISAHRLRRLRPDAVEVDPTANADTNRARLGLGESDVTVVGRRPRPGLSAAESFSGFVFAADVVDATDDLRPAIAAGADPAALAARADADLSLRRSLLHHIEHARVTVTDAISALQSM